MNITKFIFPQDLDLIKRLVYLNPKFKDKRKILITNESRLSIPNFEKIISIDDININIIKDCIFFLFFHSDDEYLYHVSNILKNNGIWTIPWFGDFTNCTYDEYVYKLKNLNNRLYVFTNKNTKLALEKTLIRNNDISHFDYSIHGNICQALEQTKKIDGDFIEIGVYKGGSALTALNYMNFADIKKKAYLLDTFDGFNYEESLNSSDSYWYDTHKLYGEDATMNYISNILTQECPNQYFKLIKSNICKDNLPAEINRISIANIDVDSYEATSSAINKVAEKMSDNGIIICEDSACMPSLLGAYYAMEEFLTSELGNKFIKIHLNTQYFLIKKYS
jgi:hypothetical protein